VPVRGVIFDMGGTLLHYNAPDATWEETENTGARPIYALLRDAGYSLPPEDEALARAWRHALSLWNSIATASVEDLKLGRQIRLMAALWGIADLPDDLVERAGLAYIGAIRAHVYPLEGAAAPAGAARWPALQYVLAGPLPSGRSGAIRAAALPGAPGLLRGCRGVEAGP